MPHAAAPAERLRALRAELVRRDLEGFVVPLADEHLGEYVPPSARRLEWLTGFSGSAGMAVVLADQAALFVDGRYTLQARDEVDGEAFSFHHLVEEPPHRWIAARLAKGARLGFDPWLHSADEATRLRAACRKAGAELVGVDDNPIDAAWHDRPSPPCAPLAVYDASLAGRTSADKRAEIGGLLREAGEAAAVLGAPESIAWLLNLRGGDLAYAPVALCFAVVGDDGTVDLFVDRRKVSGDMAAHLGDGVRIAPPDAFAGLLDRMGAEKRRVRVDTGRTAAWIVDRLTAAGAEASRAADPCLLPKARRNPVELDGLRAAHRRDGVAMVRFLAWLTTRALAEATTEIGAAERLEALRRLDPAFRGPSFPTISGSGPNGAIVHYRATPRTDRRLHADEPYLVDSGGQYPDGTTDITRTLCLGAPSAEARDRFTRVLKGHIALARVRFPDGTTGGQLDALARLALWEAGLDYDHGTGHGVGHFLNVHEGPQRISKRPDTTALEPGMVLSNEPGYYKAGAYGIRIENLQTVVRVAAPDGAERPLLGFEALTLCPIDRTLIEPALLGGEEIAWLDGYHARARDELMPLLAGDPAADWLEKATRPLV